MRIHGLATGRKDFPFDNYSTCNLSSCVEADSFSMPMEAPTWQHLACLSAGVGGRVPQHRYYSIKQPQRPRLDVGGGGRYS